MTTRLIQVEEAYPLRLSVLRPGGSLKDVQWPHDLDAEAFHLGAENGAGLIAIGSCYPERHKGIKGTRQFRLRGMATHPDHRGRGAGGLIVRHALELIRQRGAQLVWCNAREKALPFYEREGFKPHGDPFELPGIGMHQVMWRPV
ncbi:MAG: GNAT family N-acetyltransferase [Flavobacteriales bacterium]